jgi:hypothetical protein
MDEQALARLIAAEVAKLQQQIQVRACSAICHQD